MRIVLVHFYFGTTPTPSYQEIASALRARGHTVFRILRKETGDFAWHNGKSQIAELRAPVRVPATLQRLRFAVLIWKRLAFFFFMLRIRRFLKQVKPDIVQVNPKIYAWMLPLFMPDHIRYILDIRQTGNVRSSSLIDRFRDWRTIRKWQFYARFIYHNTCFLHTKAAIRVLGERWSKRGVIVPLGVDYRFLVQDRMDSISGSQNKPVQFIYVGTLSKGRYLEQILFAVQQVLRTTDKFQVVLIGPDAAERFYHCLVNELQLSSVVSIKSQISYKDVPDILRDNDVALAYIPDEPAWRYQPTLKVLEYRALGLPIIATDIEPNRDIVEDGVNGLLIQNSIDSLARGMLRFITDCSFLKHCQLNAQKMRKGITWNEVARKYEQDVYSLNHKMQ